MRARVPLGLERCSGKLFIIRIKKVTFLKKKVKSLSMSVVTGSLYSPLNCELSHYRQVSYRKLRIP